MYLDEYVIEHSINNDTDFLQDHDVIMVQKIFSIITIMYIPFILVTNSLVFWATILCSYFHTPLNILLFSLSVADLLTAVFCIPMYAFSYMDSTKYVIYYNKYACLGWFISGWISHGGSVIHLMFIACDRYIILKWPSKYKSIVTINRTINLVIAIWFYILVVAFLPMMGWNNYDSSVAVARRCNFFLVIPKLYAFTFVFSTIYLGTIIPSIIYVRIYIHIYKELKMFKRQRDTMTKEEIFMFKERISSVKITIALMFTFIILWLPYLLIVPFKYFKVFSPRHIEILKVISQLFYFANAMVNAPIYALGRRDYKRTYMLMLITKPWKWKCRLKEFEINEQMKRNMEISSLTTSTRHSSHSWSNITKSQSTQSFRNLKEIGSDIY